MHCLSDSGEASEGELSTDECRDVIDQLSAIKVFQVNIGGGEPFLRDDFLPLIRYFHEKGMVTCVSTNGMLVDNGLVKKLSALKGLYLQVSLDGATAEVNDEIRGEGTYQKALLALDCLARHGFSFSINMVLTRRNFSQLNAMVDLAQYYGASLRVSRFRPAGRGASSKSRLGPDKDQLESFAEWLEKNHMVGTGDSFFCLTSEKRRRKGLDMCGAAKMTCCISPTGDVYPCAFLQEKPFLAGNIRTHNLKHLWDDSPIFKGLRRLSPDDCLSCMRFDECRGGCPAVAYHTYHDINMPDPECLLNLKRLNVESSINFKALESGV